MGTAYERMKAAWESIDRDGALNRAVEVMAAEGITRGALSDALVRLLLEVRAAGADDDTEEIINEVGDRLHGWCHKDYHIHARDEAPSVAPAVNGPHPGAAAPPAVS